MHRSTLLAAFAALAFAGCVSEADSDPQAIVDAAIAAHGGGVMDAVKLSFTFRGTPFSLEKDGGRFAYRRTTADSLGRTVEDVIDNDGAHRFVGQEEVEIDSITTRRINSDLMSVAYFALLPLPLNDAAVKKRYVGSQTIKGQPYDIVEVTFAQERGGRDYQDIFVYWFHADRHTMDYLAYSYVLGDDETGPNATGIRFRQAGNVRDVDGYRVQDYRNFTADAGTDLTAMGLLFEVGELRVVSDVQLEDVRVESIGSGF